MAKFLTTQATSSCIEEIIMSADKWLVLITPYLKLSRNFYERLLDADRRKTKMIVVYKEDKLKAEGKRKLLQLENLTLRSCDNLHAKCYLNERSAVITSMNLYEYSQNNNREMGVLIEKEHDAELYGNAMKEVGSILNKSQEVHPATASGRSAPSRIGQEAAHPQADGQRSGYCIRCGRGIPFDLFRPHCPSCFSEWVVWENPDYEEYFCHTCGRSELTTRLKPQCRSCFAKSQK
ncbi:MAG: phospholipase D-like domain-containing protein [Chloroflexota bacterium]